ncbi:MAG: hypothetical protein LBU60_00110 [Clostridiales bacterium]|nr:hypothetical protein [Clostridiales bacterium]
MRVFNDIEGLVYYATVHLMLDELDTVMVRNQIIDELNIKDYIISEVDYAAIEELQDPNSLLTPIVDYAVGTNIIHESVKDAFSSKLMSILSKRPSELAEVFLDTLKQSKHTNVNFANELKSPQKATDWFYDYNIKNGYINLSKLDKNIFWEAKGTTGKIELVVNLLGTDSSNLSNKKDAYPECELCLENEGNAAKLKHTMRTMPINIINQEWFWYYAQNGVISQQFYAVSSDHVQKRSEKNNLQTLFDFNKILPHYFVGFESDSVQSKHQYILGGHKNMPLFKVKNQKTYLTKQFPLVEIQEVEWYNNVLRVVGVDSFRMLECGNAIIDEWQRMSKQNTFVTALHRDREGRFFLDIVLCDATKLSNESCSIRTSPLKLFDFLGLFELDKTMQDDIVELEKFATKETKFVADKLSDKLKKHKSLIEKLLKEVGSSKATSKEAQLYVREELSSIAEQVLIKNSVFESQKDKDDFYKKFNFDAKK